MQKKGLILNNLFFLLVVFFFYSCNNKEKEQQLIVDAIELKKELYVEERKAMCYLELMQEVDRLVDSLVLVRSIVRSDIERPEKPERPVRPEVNYIDTIQIKADLE